VLGNGAFFKQHLAGFRDAFLSVAGQPEAVFERQVVQRADAVQRRRDLLDWGGVFGLMYGSRKHLGWPRQCSFRIADAQPNAGRRLGGQRLTGNETKSEDAKSGAGLARTGKWSPTGNLTKYL